ncbi:MAG: FAD-dependent oxidoreductase, partial [Pelagibacteraceae bacterium]
RRDKANMPGSAREVANAEEEGVNFIWLSSPKSFEGKDQVEKVIINKMRLGEPDSSGRQSPKIIEGAEESLEADIVIKALGFDPENIPKLFNEQDLEVTKWGTIKTDLKNLKTNIEGVFAAGDIVRGASLVVWAIRDGRDAAKGISRYLKSLIKKNKAA